MCFLVILRAAPLIDPFPILVLPYSFQDKPIPPLTTPSPTPLPTPYQTTSIPDPISNHIPVTSSHPSSPTEQIHIPDFDHNPTNPSSAVTIL